MSAAFNLDPDELPEPAESDTSAAGRVPNPLEVCLFPDEAAGWAVRVTPGSATAKVLALVDPVRLSQAGRVDALVALDRLAAWTVALQHRVIAAMSADPHAGAIAPKLEREWVSEDVRVALGESSIGARARMRTASDLVHRLPDTLDALEAGRLTPRLAAAVVDTVQVLDENAAREVEQAVLPEPEHVSDPVPTQAAFRARLRRARIKADPRSAEQKAARAAEDRDVWILPGENAMAHLSAALPAEGAATVMAAVHAKVDQLSTPGDARTKAQRRADGLVQICADYLAGDNTEKCKIKNDTAIGRRAGAQAPHYHGLRPQIQVSVALSTLLGRDEQPADLDGYGPIPADLARRIAADPSGTWRRLVTDELGRLVDYGRSTYKPPADLAQFVIARDRTCQAPGCMHPAAKSDLHHLTAFSQGGHTNADSLIPADERHHYAVHDGAWTVERLDDGITQWTSPTGHTYHRTPDPYPIDTTRKIKNDTSENRDDDPRAANPPDASGEKTDWQARRRDPETDEPPF